MCPSARSGTWTTVRAGPRVCRQDKRCHQVARRAIAGGDDRSARARRGLDSKGNTESKRESVLLVVSTRTKNAMSGLKAKGAKQRESMVLAASTKTKDALAGLQTVGGRMSTLLSLRRSGGLSQRNSPRPVSPKISSHLLQAGPHVKQKENDSGLETESLTDVEDGEEMALLPEGPSSTSSLRSESAAEVTILPECRHSAWTSQPC